MARMASLKRRIGIVVCLAVLTLGLTLPTGAVEARRATCVAYDQAEFFLLTGIDSEYGGTFCTRH
jgi:hypothetical protein